MSLKKIYKLYEKSIEIDMCTLPPAEFYQNKEPNSIEKKIDDDFAFFIKTITKEIPRENLNLFFNNYKTLKIYKSGIVRLHYSLLSRKNVGALYDTIKNIIIVFPIISKHNFQSVKTTMYHEFFHMASTYYNKKNKRIFCGFSIAEYNSFGGASIGRGLNEGYTQIMAERYFNKDNIQQNLSLNYLICTETLLFLEKIIGRQKMEGLYLNADFSGLIKELSQYESLENIFQFINSLDYILKQERTKKSINLQKVLKEEVEKIGKFLIKCYINKEKKSFNNGKFLINVQNFYNMLYNRFNLLGIDISLYTKAEILDLINFEEKIK